MSTFSGINTALSALQAQRRGLELAGQNIANAGTVGYSRQRLELTPVGSATPGRYVTPSLSNGGVQVSDVTRMRDAFLDARGYVEHERGAVLDGRAEVLADVQQVFDEPSANGLQTKLSQLWAGFTDVADNPGDQAARGQLLIRAKVVVAGLNSAAGELATQYAGRRTELSSTVNEINLAAGQLAALNDAVLRATQAGASGNELADQRDLQVMRLVELTGATAVPAADGTVGLRLGGADLVKGAVANQLAVTGSATLGGQTADPATLRWAVAGPGPGPAVAGSGGRTAALLDGLGTILPDGLAKLDAVALTLATTVNTTHAQGFTAAGVGGGTFFSGTTAAGIGVFITKTTDIAASSSATLALDGDNADRLANLSSAAGGADETYRTAVALLGAEVDAADQLATTQYGVSSQVDAARLSAAGVNIDEELSSMLTYQRAYEAASRVMSAIDSMLDTLINRTGS